MSRPLRIQYPGAWYHVMNRGLNRRQIFHEDAHRHYFLELLDDIHRRYGVQTHAYCLMGNHYHLIFHTPKENLSRAMRHLDGLYTQYFNRQMKRDGPLFRGRYKSMLMETESYLLVLSRYIHLNPVIAKLSTAPEDYRWSSYLIYMRRTKRPSWLYCDEVLSRCSTAASVKKYREFVKEGIDEKTLKLFSRASYPSVLGDDKWIEDIKKQHIVGRQADEEIPDLKTLILNAIEPLEMLMQKVANWHEVSISSLKQRGNKHKENLPRNIFVYIASTYAGYANKAIAACLGNISDAGISLIKQRIQKRIMCDALLKREIEKLKASMFNVET